MELVVLFGSEKKLTKVLPCSCSTLISEFSGIKKRWPEKIGLERIDQLMDAGIEWLQSNGADHHLIDLYRTLEGRLRTTDKRSGITLKDIENAPVDEIVKNIIAPLLAKPEKMQKIKIAHKHTKPNKIYQKRA